MALSQTKRMSNLKVKIQTTLRIHFTYQVGEVFFKANVLRVNKSSMKGTLSIL